MKNLRALMVLTVMAPAVSALSLSACAPLTMLSAPEVNLAASSYGAADMLLQQAQSRLSQHTVLALGALQDLKVPQNPAPFGRIVASQVGARFVQLGYNVHTPDDIGTVSAGDMPAAPATPVLKAPLSLSTPATAGRGTTVGHTQAMLTGHYVRSGQELMVNIRIVDMSSGQIWGSYDYTIPVNNEIVEMITPPPSPKPVTTASGQTTENRGFFDF